jgi:hypothetical protein
LLAEGAALAVAHALVAAILDDLAGLALVNGQGCRDSLVGEEDGTTRLGTRYQIKLHDNWSKRLACYTNLLLNGLA